MKYSQKDVDKLARTILGEALGQPYDGQVAVANTIANRVYQGIDSSGRRRGVYSSPADVATNPKQYNAWSPNFSGAYANTQISTSDPRYQQAADIAEGVLSGSIPDNTAGATHYYNPSIAAPAWGNEMAANPNFQTIGDHAFGTVAPGVLGADRNAYETAANLSVNPDPTMARSEANADQLSERGFTGTLPSASPPQPSVQNPHPDTSVNPYGGLLGGLGAGVTAAMQAANGIGTIAKSIGGLFSPGQQPSVSLPNHPQTPTPLGGIGPVGPVSYGGSLGATGVNAPHTPTPASAYSPPGGSYQSTAGSSNPYQGASHPYESGYTPSYSQLAPGAATATQMFGADPSPVATAKPSFTTTRSLNPNYEKEMAAYNAYQNANIPSAVDSFMENPSLSAVTPGTFESAFPSAPKPTTPAPPKPQQYTTKKVANPMSPSFAAGTPVMDAIGNIVGAMGLNGKAFTPSFAPGTSVTDQNGNVVGSMTGQGMQTQKPSLLGGLMSALGIGGGMSPGLGGNGGGQATSSPGMSGGITAGGIGGMSGKNGSTSSLGGGRKGNDSGQQHG